jgi:cation:H+ antiporter
MSDFVYDPFHMGTCIHGKRSVGATGMLPASAGCVLSVLSSLAILVSGFLLATAGDAIAEQTGLGASFVGLILGGVSTSFPEVSTTVSAVRLRQYEMAFADAFGMNLFSVMLIFFSDLVYSGPPVLNEAGRFSALSILLSIALTAIYLAGIIERRNWAIAGIGLDSLVVLILYLGGLVLLFHLK